MIQVRIVSASQKVQEAFFHPVDVGNHSYFMQECNYDCGLFLRLFLSDYYYIHGRVIVTLSACSEVRKEQNKRREGETRTNQIKWLFDLGRQKDPGVNLSNFRKKLSAVKNLLDVSNFSKLTIIFCFAENNFVTENSKLSY